MPGELHVQLDTPLPVELTVGAGTALFLCGCCFHREAKITDLSVLVDGRRQPVMAHGMPRLDFFRGFHPGLDPYATDGLTSDPSSSDDPALNSYASGFWALPKIHAGLTHGECTLALEAQLESGERVRQDLGAVPLTQLPEQLETSLSTDQPPVAICMATYDPPADLLAAQLDSIRAQTYRNWTCVISDDCSSPERYRTLEAAIAGDPRFTLSRAPRRLGFYRNFERAIALAPREAPLIALADQDDTWHPDKLTTLVSELGSAQLVYSDARVVARDGSLISDTWWSRRRNNHSDLLSLLVANSVTGAASLMRRELTEHALPFPPAQFAHFHDHWLGLTALALGEIRFVPRSLYDYHQHGQASLGHAAANRMTSATARLLRQRGLHERVRLWRMHYFVDICRLLQFASVLELRCEARMSRSKRRALRSFLRSEHSLAPLLRLGLRGLRELFAHRPETLGAEWMLFWALVWRRLLSLSARERPQRRLRLDAVPPPTLIQHPGRSAVDAAARAIADKIAPLSLIPVASAPARVNLLIPTIDLEHFFGGYIAKFNLASRLAERGLRVRVVTVDPVPPLGRGWRRSVEDFSGLNGLLDRVEVSFGRESAGIEVSPNDSFIATTWWTAHIAARAATQLGRERFVYLIQEYEPFTFPMGSYAALAGESYRLPHVALFSSEQLRDYFRAHKIGVYAAGARSGSAASRAFQNAITSVPAPTVEELSARESRRLLFYARPEQHAARNMFEIGVLALGRALEDGAFDGWELNGIGSVERGRRISLGSGAELSLLPRSDQSAYAELLREHDVGLALMYTPHPSLVPIEMASAGMLTVTNSFENKTAESLAQISPNLLAPEPTVDAIAAALRDAAAQGGQHERRVQGSAVNWSRDWRTTFGDELLEWVSAKLDAGGP